jgi:hypothetical protein
MRLYCGAACELDFLERTLAKSAIRRAEPQRRLEAVRLCAFTPPGSPYSRHVVDFPLAINNLAEQAASQSDESRPQAATKENFPERVRDSRGLSIPR